MIEPRWGGIYFEIQCEILATRVDRGQMGLTLVNKVCRCERFEMVWRWGQLRIEGKAQLGFLIVFAKTEKREGQASCTDRTTCRFLSSCWIMAPSVLLTIRSESGLTRVQQIGGFMKRQR